MPGHYIRQTWRYDPVLYAPTKYRRACAYQAFVPDRLADIHLALDTGVAGIISDAEGAIRELNSRAPSALAPLGRLLLRTESISSSRVEGLSVDARGLAWAESRAAAGMSVSPTAHEVLANIDAMQAAIDAASATRPFTTEDILAIHGRLMSHAPNRHIAGIVRTGQNWIGGNDYNPCGAEFVPPPPGQVDALLADLTDAVNRDDPPPIVQAALVHAQFETIHPFEDGNGRTGRALVQVVLRRRKIAPDYVPPVSVILAAKRDAYIDGLGDFRTGDPVRWVESFAAAAARAARLAAAYVRSVRELKAEWRCRLASGSNPRAGAAAWALIDELPAHPVISTAGAVAATGRAKSAVHTAVQELETAGVLLPLARSQRNRAWEAAGLLDLVAGLEAGRSPPVGRGQLASPRR